MADSDTPSSRRMNRREFVLTTTAVGFAGAAEAGSAAQAPAVLRSRVKPLVIASDNGHQFKNGGARTCVETAFALMTGGTRRARRPHCRRQHRRARSARHQRRVRRAAERGRGGAARLLLHARPEAPRRRGGVPRRCAHPFARGAEGDGPDRSPSARRSRRAGVRPQSGVHHRAGPQYGTIARRMAGVEAPQRSGALPRPDQARGGAAPGGSGDDARKAGSIRRTSTAPSTAMASTPPARSAA